MSKALDTTGRECHDCGQSGPHWCSINHGVLLCDECCSVHLSLGRHVSQIKSLEKTNWPTTQLNLIKELSLHGANLIWEYSLRDPQNRLPRKKPAANDSFPNKADFIRAKYQQMAYINRSKDETTGTLEDLNLQLHSIVRTDNIVTCLRFLSQGADPNFRNPETGTSSIHVAASRGQSNQIELLCIFGGDPATVDASGVPPEEHARANGYSDLADRLVELQYELTDRLLGFIGSKQPDHKAGEHIPLSGFDQIASRSNPSSVGRQRLQQLSNALFEDLAMDIFDEVDRRELKTIWHAQVDQALIPLHVVPFLPVNPAFSATRNQGRQKLARYGTEEFSTLIYDILTEFRRRYLRFIQRASSIKASPSSQPHDDLTATLAESDDEPYYDKVASDEDCNSSEQPQRVKHHKRLKKSTKSQLDDSSMPSPSDTNLLENSHLETTENQHPEELKTRVRNTEIQVRYLASAHIDLKNELLVLHQMIQRLLDESVLNKLDQQLPNNTTAFLNKNRASQVLHRTSLLLLDNASRKSSPFIESDYDNTTLFDDLDKSLANATPFAVFSDDKRSSRTVQRFPQINEYASDSSRSYQFTDFISPKVESSVLKSATNASNQTLKRDIPVSIFRSRSCSERRRKLISPLILVRKGSYNHVPLNDDIADRTQQITADVTEFFNLIKENQSHRYVVYAKRINHSVQDMIELSERLISNDDIRANLEMLNANTRQLLFHTTTNDTSTVPVHLLVDDCYGIALATRNLLSLYEKL